MIAILVAVKQELQPILRLADAPTVVRLEHLDFHEGTLAGAPVALLALGVGKECARIAAEVTIKCYRPDLMISAGFGGALQEPLKAGDLVVGTELLDILGDDGKVIEWHTPPACSRHDVLNLDAAGHQAHFGRVATANEMILTAVHKQRIGQATGALAIDMETSAVATVAAAHGTPLLAVRCITDTVRENLPAEFNDFFVIGQLKASRVAAALVRRPGLVWDLARLGYRAQVAGESLARFLRSILPQLCHPGGAPQVL
jgi:adenosylhomocysteine nucleosidase